MVDFDPNGIACGEGIFGMPYKAKDAKVILLPVCYDATTSYRAGTSRGPEAILKASPQLDFYDDRIKEAWKIGIFMERISKKAQDKNDKVRAIAERYLSGLEEGRSPENDKEMSSLLSIVNQASAEMVEDVSTRAEKYLARGKIVGVVGGDHSTPLGLIQALAKRNEDFGVLHIDAHADLRKAYEGFTYSHASIMYNVMQIPQVKKLVQVGIRDYCEEEVDRITDSHMRIMTCTDEEAFEHKYNWSEFCKRLVNLLPQKVYISFDIDGLKPELCPNTGTPVPGGLEFNQSIMLLNTVADSHRKIIGFDLNEVGPQEWDANVGSRILYKMANLAAVSQGKAERQKPRLRIFN